MHNAYFCAGCACKCASRVPGCDWMRGIGNQDIGLYAKALGPAEMENGKRIGEWNMVRGQVVVGAYLGYTTHLHSAAVGGQYACKAL